MKRDGVENGLYHAAVVGQDEYVGGPHVDGHVLAVPDLLQLVQELEGEQLLAQVVARLDDHGQQAPRRIVAVRRGLAYARLLGRPRLAQRVHRRIVRVAHAAHVRRLARRRRVLVLETAPDLRRAHVRHAARGARRGGRRDRHLIDAESATRRIKAATTEARSAARKAVDGDGVRSRMIGAARRQQRRSTGRVRTETKQN